MQLPPTWRVARLEELQHPEPRAITDGPFGSHLTSAHYTEQGPRVVRLQNIGDGQFVDAKAHISQSHFKSLWQHEVKSGDLLVASLGEVLPRACLAPDWLGPAIVKADCIRVRLADNVDKRWVLYALQRAAVRRWADEHRHGVGRPRLGLKVIRNIPIPLPDLREQRRIVEILEDHLSRIDAGASYVKNAQLRADQYLAIAAAAELRSLSGEVTKLGQAAKWGSGGTPSTGNPSNYENGVIPWVNSGDLSDAPLTDVPKQITDTGFERSSARWVPAGSLLVAMYGATVGKLATTTFPVTTNQAVAHAIPAAGVHVDYLFWFLRSQRRELIAAAKGGAQPNISQTVLKNWPIIVPSHAEQVVAIEKLQGIETLVNHLHLEMSRAQIRHHALRKALLTATFSGQLTGRSSSDKDRIEELAGV